MGREKGSSWRRNYIRAYCANWKRRIGISEDKEQFIELLGKYFGGADLPIVFYYTGEENRAERVQPPKRHRCVVCELAKVRNGKPLYFDIDAIGCGGGKRYLGFDKKLRPNFEYFL